MKKAGIKRQLGVLRALIYGYHRAIMHPAIGRALIYSREFFSDDLIRAACLALMLNFGDWEAAKLDNSFRAFPASRVKRLFEWAGKVRGA